MFIVATLSVSIDEIMCVFFKTATTRKIYNFSNCRPAPDVLTSSDRILTFGHCILRHRYVCVNYRSVDIEKPAELFRILNFTFIGFASQTRSMDDWVFSDRVPGTRSALGTFVPTVFFACGGKCQAACPVGGRRLEVLNRCQHPLDGYGKKNTGGGRMPSLPCPDCGIELLVQDVSRRANAASCKSCGREVVLPQQAVVEIVCPCCGDEDQDLHVVVHNC